MNVKRIFYREIYVKKGSHLCSHIVWFGEPVLRMEEAIPVIREAEILVIVRTSLFVYSTVGLINYSKYEIPKWLIDQKDLVLPKFPHLKFINKKTTVRIDYLMNYLLKHA
ncbi:MAG: hypothetical protein V4615_09805 [Bacteroidota bacterium]